MAKVRRAANHPVLPDSLSIPPFDARGLLFFLADGRVHVWDAAAREWLLPRVAALSESKAAADALRAMMKRMLAPDPSERPIFPELLEELT